jgi:hypothetical protein
MFIPSSSKLVPSGGLPERSRKTAAAVPASADSSTTQTRQLGYMAPAGSEGKCGATPVAKSFFVARIGDRFSDASLGLH